jgi:XisI protein
VDNQLLIEQILQEWCDYAFRETGKTVFDRQNNRFLLLEVAWENNQRIHDVVAHVDIIDDKFWIQEDNTPTGIGTDLEERGVQKDKIVLAFYPLAHRKNGAYAAQ